MSKPILIILVGIPGSGKSTYAKKYIHTHKNCYTGIIHLSSDSIRKELYGDESIQGNPEEVFALMRERTLIALNNGQSVLYDATSMTRKSRENIINVCPKFVRIECHVIWQSIDICIERDANRNRTVGKDIIDRMVKTFQCPYYDEGIDEIKIIIPFKFNYDKYRTDLENDMKISHDNPNHSLDICDHCNSAKRYAAEHNFHYNIQVAAGIHDIGKPYVKSFKNSKGETTDIAHYYNHQCVGAWQACAYCDGNLDVIWLISTHMDPFMNTKYYRNLPPYLKTMVDQLHEADLASH